MDFPISAEITVASATYPTAVLLKVDGNAGEIPNEFQCAQFAEDEGGEPTVLLTSKVVPMTEKQWADWTDQADANYILQAMADNLGVEIKLAATTKKKGQK